MRTIPRTTSDEKGVSKNSDAARLQLRCFSFRRSTLSTQHANAAYTHNIDSHRH